MINDLIVEICGKLKKHIVKLIDSFYPPEILMGTVLAPANGELYKGIMEKLASQ